MAQVNFQNMVYIIRQILPTLLFCMAFVLVFLFAKVKLRNGND